MSKLFEIIFLIALFYLLLKQIKYRNKISYLHRLHINQIIEFTKNNITVSGFITEINKEKKTCTIISIENGIEEIPFKLIHFN